MIHISNKDRRSKTLRNDPMFLRNQFEKTGKYEIPLIKKQDIDLMNIELIACSDTKLNDYGENRRKGVHFFKDDYKFESYYKHPDCYIDRLKQYRFVLTPDFSTYGEMDNWRQIESVGKNRWCGAYWQSKGLKVIPTIGWSDLSSFDFCFDGVEKHCIVGISTIGCKRNNKVNFMKGYNEMIRRIEPEAIICLGKPFDEMEGNIIYVDYKKSKQVVR